MPDSPNITQLLRDARSTAEIERLLDSIYPNLRAIAKGHLRRWANSDPGVTELIHEAYPALHRALLDPARQFENRARFYAYANTVMRHKLLELAQRQVRTEVLSEDFSVVDSEPWRQILVDHALDTLRAAHPREVEAFDLKYYGGHTYEEIRDIMGFSQTAEVKAALAFMRARLAQLIVPGTVRENPPAATN